ncbi:hypothetical protein [Exiguobacterium aurantiacum]|uniref:hypothetical protein n=1 Tax=Exiguobacterium aurantiacum TaxID=33987 RepID=UPI001E3BA9FF|nr:hypothetical protein [Exiguobacterium aurantiacum]
MSDLDNTINSIILTNKNSLPDEKHLDKSDDEDKYRKSVVIEPTIPLNEISSTDPTMKATLWIGSFGIYDESILTFYSNGFVKRELFILHTFSEEQRIESGWYDKADSAKVLKKFNSFKTHLWPDLFVETETIIHDGIQWKLEVSVTGEEPRVYSGSNAYPPKWRSFKKLFGHC